METVNGACDVVEDLRESVRALVNLVCERDGQIKLLLEKHLDQNTDAVPSDRTQLTWNVLKLRLEKLKLEDQVHHLQCADGTEDGGDQDGTDSGQIRTALADKENEEYTCNSQILLQQLLKENYNLKLELSVLKQTKERNERSIDDLHQTLESLTVENEKLVKESLLLHKLTYKQRKQDYADSSLLRSYALGGQDMETAATVSSGTTPSKHHVLRYSGSRTATTTQTPTNLNSHTTNMHGVDKNSFPLSSTPLKNQLPTPSDTLTDISTVKSGESTGVVSDGVFGVKSPSESSAASDDTSDLLEHNHIDPGFGDASGHNGDLTISPDWGNSNRVIVPKDVSDLQVESYVKYLTPINLIHTAQVMEVDRNVSTIKLLDSDTKRMEYVKFSKVLMVWT